MARPRHRGIAPALLLAQVRSTAGWALELESPQSWRSILLDAPALEARWQEPAARVEYLRTMLAAHFVTVATFVPTDVDAHIRHHFWQGVETEEELRAAVAAADEAASWDPRAVSERVVAVPGESEVAGHEGEWFSVRAGALGRALVLGAREVAESLAAAIDGELEREARALGAARRSGEALLALRMSTTSAHNCGDLSRVIEAWPAQVPGRREHLARFGRLGHEDPSRYGGEHHLAGHVNKLVMASENHRHLPLREPRALRKSRAFLVPLAPHLDGWGETLGKSPELDDEERGEILAALVRGLELGVDRWGYQRAIAGLHRTAPGGIDRLARHVPARLRHHVERGPVRDALRLSPERFAARMDNAWRAATASYPG